MAKSNSQQILLLVTLIAIAGGGTKVWLDRRETPEKSVQFLAAQNIDFNEENFFAQIKAGNTQNIHNFLIAGGHPGTVDLKGQGISALMVAVETGNKDIVSMLLAALPSDPVEAMKILNLQDTANARTALMIAVEKDNPDIVKLLLSRGSDPSVTDKTQETPLMVAIRHKSMNVLPILIADDNKLHHGASINGSDAGGETPLTYAIRGNSKDMVNTLIAAKADAISADRSGVTPLMVAAEVGDESVGTVLLAAGAKPDTADRSGNTPLSIAIRHAHPAFAKLLIEKGANPDYRTSGPLPLQVAIGMDPFDPQLFTYILEHSKQTGNLDASMLFDAIDHKNAGLAKALLEHGIDAKAANARGESLLYHAIESGLEDVALALIEKGANTSQMGVTGVTPIERATKHNEIKVVEKLLALGVAPDQKTTEGYTLAEMAVYSGYPEILDALLAKGAKLEKDFGVLWAIRDGGGKSVPVLLKYGAHPDVMSNSGDPALWLAASAGETEAVAALIKYKALLNAPNTSQLTTPLAIASHGGQTAVVKLLVESGAKIDTADTFGMTPLAHAAYMSKPDVVEYLISKGADRNATDKQGRSIADLAALAEPSAGRDKVTTLLQQKK